MTAGEDAEASIACLAHAAKTRIYRNLAKNTTFGWLRQAEGLAVGYWSSFLPRHIVIMGLWVRGIVRYTSDGIQPQKRREANPPFAALAPWRVATLARRSYQRVAP
jgi:hypothetical protein